ncbi:MAG: SRPBCC family protein [Acidobacteria bacterium]|nr:MAG: SRPBCC family protein [Acidobacteriota bacterium]
MQTSVYDERETALGQQGRETSEQWVPPEEVGSDSLAKGLGWFSVGLGVAQVVAPEQLARLIGVQNRPFLMRLLGAREIAAGLGILMQDRPTPWLWSRVAGDAVDLTLLGIALGSEESDRTRLGVATAAVLGVTALDVISSTRLTQERAPIRVRKAITINRPADEIYRFWKDFQNLPRFMKHLESVRMTGGNRSHWTATGPAGTRVEWDAETTEDRPGQVIAWRSTEPADVENWGSVTFRDTSRGTELHVDLAYFPPGGRLGSWAAWFMGEEPGQQLQDDLRRLKQFLETGEIPTTEGQPSGPSRAGVFSRLLRTGERQRR